MWFWYALGFALISSFSVTVAKKVMKSVDHYTYLFWVSILTFPFLLTFSLIFYPSKVDFGRAFWLATFVGTLISVVASIFAYKAIRGADISLISPISSFNPVFTTVLSWIFLGEILSLNDLLAILIIVLGAYLMKISEFKDGFFRPLKSLLNDKSVRLAFLAYFLWSVSPLLEKTAILNVYPQNPPLAASVGKFISICMLALPAFYRSRTRFGDVWKSRKWIVLDGFLGGVGISLAFMAYSAAPLGLSTAVFKLSVVLVPIWGWVFLGEKNIKERLLGAFVMLGGVILLTS